jgi:2-polyprenyl-3-methyl-5-hydroxy-6-metoxy-1,4-benzoquinol methylase
VYYLNWSKYFRHTDLTPLKKYCAKDMKITKYDHEEECPLCHNATSNVLATELRRGEGVVYYCSACHHGFLVPKKDFNEKEYYSESYRQEYSHNAKVASTNAREIFNIYRHYQRDRLLDISPYLTAETTLLEVGASAGQFLSHVKDKVALVNAIELDKACCAFMQKELGIEADSNYLSESIFAHKTYNIVCAFQVMEHVVDPVAFLQDLHQSTKKGGTISVEVPNLHDPLLTVWNIDPYQKFYYHSAHLQYFTDDSLKKIALDAGFISEQIEVRFTQDYNLLNHLNWIMNEAPQANCNVGLSEIDLNGINPDISIWLTDQMRRLNDEYILKLVNAKATSNLMMMIKNV